MGAIWEPTFASSSPQVPSSSLASRWRPATTSSPSPSLTLTASLAKERARLPGSNSIVLYPLSGDPDDLVGDGEESLMLLSKHVPSSGDDKSALILVEVVSLSCEESFTCGSSFSFEDSQQKRTFLLPWLDVTLSWLELLRDELKILPSEGAGDEDELLKRAGPLLEQLTSLLTLDRG